MSSFLCSATTAFVTVVAVSIPNVLTTDLSSKGQRDLKELRSENLDLIITTLLGKRHSHYDHDTSIKLDVIRSRGLILSCSFGCDGCDGCVSTYVEVLLISISPEDPERTPLGRMYYKSLVPSIYLEA
ncbi:hypothetical protein GGS21DRAFT_75253 [Xylaria nigripes]|nr:hypothetical protein GGS21DRAFT_75253 [Xylaria nigripes]